MNDVIWVISWITFSTFCATGYLTNNIVIQSIMYSEWTIVVVSALYHYALCILYHIAETSHHRVSLKHEICLNILHHMMYCAFYATLYSTYWILLSASYDSNDPRISGVWGFKVTQCMIMYDQYFLRVRQTCGTIWMTTRLEVTWSD